MANASAVGIKRPISCKRVWVEEKNSSSRADFIGTRKELRRRMKVLGFEMISSQLGFSCLVRARDLTWATGRNKITL
jgi:hypothetical protein